LQQRHSELKIDTIDGFRHEPIEVWEAHGAGQIFIDVTEKFAMGTHFEISAIKINVRELSKCVPKP